MFRHPGSSLMRMLGWKQGDEDDTWSKKAIESLLKKFQKQGNKEAIANLEEALRTQGTQPSQCVTIPRSLDGRLQVSHRKALPHVIYCRVYRWPDLQSHHELKALPGCRYCFESGQQEICINPYHYERVDAASLLPPVLVPRYSEPPPPPPPPPQPAVTPMSCLNGAAALQQQSMAMEVTETAGGGGGVSNGPGQLLQGVENFPAQVQNFPLGEVDITMQYIQQQQQSAFQSAAINTMEHAAGAAFTQINQPAQLPTPSLPITPGPAAASGGVENFMLNFAPHTLSLVPNTNIPQQIMSPSPTTFLHLQQQQQQSSAATASSFHTAPFSPLQPLPGCTTAPANNALQFPPTQPAIAMPFLPTPQFPQVAVAATAGVDHIAVPFSPCQHWATINYYELNTRIGEQVKVASPTVQIDGFTEPMTAVNPNKISLGLYPNVNRNSTIESTRRHIGKGVKLTYVPYQGTLYAECLSESAVFVQSRNCNYMNGFHPTTVVKIPHGVSLKIFDSAKFGELLNRCVQAGFHPTMEMTKMTIIRMSFVKGWGADYQRQEVTSTPCWIEINLHAPLIWLDRALAKLGPPSDPISSMS